MFDRFLTQPTTYWPPASGDGFGDTGFGAPSLIMCSWQDQNALVYAKSGQEVVSDAKVYARQAMLPAGYLAQGDQTAAADPRSVTGARQIIAVQSSPNLNASKKIWKALL